MSYQFLASDYIQNLELRGPQRHKNGEIEVVPVVLYPMDLKNDCEFLSAHPFPEWGRRWRDFEKEGYWRDALFPIGNDSSRRSRKRASDQLRPKLLEQCAQPTGSG